MTVLLVDLRFELLDELLLVRDDLSAGCLLRFNVLKNKFQRANDYDYALRWLSVSRSALERYNKSANGPK